MTWPPPITHPLPQGDSGAPEEWRKKKAVHNRSGRSKHERSPLSHKETAAPTIPNGSR